MSLLRNRLAAFLILPALAMLVACGSSNNKATPPPTGGFDDSNLSGTYVFSTAGLDSNRAPTAIAGMFTANGNGGIAGGTVDVNDPAFSSPSLGVNVTGGTYAVTADGRGTITLNTSTSLGNSLGLDFVLSSSSHGLVTWFDSNGSGSGTLDLQTSVTQANLAGSYAFNLSGIDQNVNPFGTVGSFTLDSSGNVTAGVEDFTDGSLAFSGQTLSGSLVAQSSGAPFVAELTAVNSGDSSSFGTLTFDVYPVDATHLKFVETDNFNNGANFLSGDAYTQQGASLPTSATNYVFTVGDLDFEALAAGGVLPLDGEGNITNGYIDINDAGSPTTAPLVFGGSYVSGGSVGGRTLLNVSGFQLAAQFVGYPTANAGLQLLESDSSGFLIGAALPQSNTTFASGQGYGMNVAALNVQSGAEEDDIAEFTTTNTGFSGLVDFNDQGSITFDQTLTGTYQADTPPPGRYDFASTGFDGEVYVVDASTALFVELDTTQAGVGTLQLQNGTQSATASHHLILPHQGVFPRAAMQKDGAKWRHRKAVQ
jgi:hypothetical protein